MRSTAPVAQSIEIETAVLSVQSACLPQSLPFYRRLGPDLQATLDARMELENTWEVMSIILQDRGRPMALRRNPWCARKMQIGAVKVNKDPIWLGFGYDDTRADWPGIYDISTSPNADRTAASAQRWLREVSGVDFSDWPDRYKSKWAYMPME